MFFEIISIANSCFGENDYLLVKYVIKMLFLVKITLLGDKRVSRFRDINSLNRDSLKGGLIFSS